MEYMIIKSCHIISVICWMAGLFYLPRLFVYHSSAIVGSEMSETFKIMERRLFKFIMNPASVATWIFGIWLVFLIPSYLGDVWFQAKAMIVIALTVLHHKMGHWLQAFAEDRNVNTTRYYRIANELPTVALLAIVFLVVLKP